MGAVLADFNKETGVETWVEAASDGSLITHTRQDVTPILDANKERQAMGREGYAADKDMWFVGRIPNWVVIKWLNDHGVNFYNNDHWPHIVKLLNSSDWQWLRTGGGRL